MCALLNELRSVLEPRKGAGAEEQGSQWRRKETLWEKVTKEEMSSEMEEVGLTFRIAKALLWLQIRNCDLDFGNLTSQGSLDI